MRRLSALVVLGVLFSLLSAPGASAADPAAEIEARWQASGAEGGPLGAKRPAPDDVPYEVSGGWAQDYVKDGCVCGSIYWSTGTGARALLGPVRAKYLALGGADSPLGLPTHEEAAAGDSGLSAAFQGGRIYWSQPTGAHSVTGAILSRYRALSGASGPLGFPTSDTVPAGPSGSRVSNFVGGRVYWSSATGARMIRRTSILTKYLDKGGARGRLGLPTGEVGNVTGGRRIVFQRGRIYWSSAYGAQTVERPVVGRFVKIGAGSSYIGMPTTDTYRTSGGWKNRFRAGSIRSWDSSGSTRVTGTWLPRVQRVTASQIPYTYRSGCPVGPSGLRRVLMPYYDWAGVPRYGKLIVRTSANDDMRRVFQRAFSGRFPIRRMNPVDVYRGSDVRAMEADNTSAFNCRKVTGNPYRLSQHSYGNAIDINTFENPYVTSSTVYPSGSRTYLNRSWVRKGMIVRSGPIARGMAAEGWPWGARWSHPDYQHFSSNGG